jgi:hypothetical protein
LILCFLKGIHFIDGQCNEEVVAELDATGVEISCSYYAYPPTAETKWSYQRQATEDASGPEAAEENPTFTEVSTEIITNDKFSVYSEVT